MRFIVPFAAAFCLSACAAQSSQSSPAAADAPLAAKAAAMPDIDIPYQRFLLPNGLTVLVHEDHKTPVVALNVWYHVGSKNEPAGRHGFAHLFEHLMFEGSQHFDKDYFQVLEPAGATDMNGTTNVDRTNYFETVPTSALDRALWLESDRMGYMAQSITQAKLDQQRGVVENEKRQDENQPYGTVGDLIAEQTYPPGHPYSWTTIGSEADLNAATLADVKKWFGTYYGPNNAVLAIAGDVDTAAVKAKVEHYFGDLPPGPPVAHVQSWPAPMQGDKRMSIVDRVPLPRVYMVWNVPGDGERDNVLLQTMAEVLGGGKDSRLYQRLVYRDQIATEVEAGVDGNEIGGQLQIVATVKPGGDLGVVEKAIREELDRIRRDGPTAEELDRIDTGTYAGMVHSLDKVGGSGGKAGLLAANQTFHDDPAHYRIELGYQRDATPADVRDATQRWVTQGSFTLEVHPQDDFKAAAAGADRSKLPALSEAPALKLPPLQHDTLSNGLKLILAERHGIPALNFSLLFNAGRAADAGVKSGTAALTLDMLDEGAGKLGSPEIARREAELGASVGVANNRDVSLIGLSAITPKLADSLDLYATLVTQPTFPEAELARVKQRLLAAIVQEKSEPFGMARRVLSRQLFGEGHPYAYAGLGLPADVKAITREDLSGFQQKWLRPDNATLVVVGDTTLAQIKPLLEQKFGGWHAPDAPLPVKNTVAPPRHEAQRVFLIDKPGSAQSLILAANLAPPAADPDQEAMHTVNTALGGMFDSRLNFNLRETKHWSYGANSSLLEARDPQVYLAYANVEQPHTADSMHEMHKELVEVLGSRPLLPAEIDMAKQAQVRSLPGGFESIGEVAGAVGHLVEFGLPDDYWNAYVPRVEALTAPQLKAAAVKLVKPEELIWVVVGDLAKIEAPVRALKLGEVRVLDSDGKQLR
ncbi:M16 family metallopeptidase [Nevskia soli]|uniref:M16 family metallopeptidase n=1 Tax=Nevskia soli TaxID=418856 RepID=UPI0004A725DB|nr:pitrilysin family protein [Nevskia soli]